ncbi:MAG: hypothetical protein Q4P28_05405 [Tissierellia bacterium]|nr:hypothetical protein [Tissierellia bacterium]
MKNKRNRIIVSLLILSMILSPQRTFAIDEKDEDVRLSIKSEEMKPTGKEEIVQEDEDKTVREEKTNDGEKAMNPIETETSNLKEESKIELEAIDLIEQENDFSNKDKLSEVDPRIEKEIITEEIESSEIDPGVEKEVITEEIKSSEIDPGVEKEIIIEKKESLEADREVEKMMISKEEIQDQGKMNGTEKIERKTQKALKNEKAKILAENPIDSEEKPSDKKTITNKNEVSNVEISDNGTKNSTEIKKQVETVDEIAKKESETLEVAEKNNKIESTEMKKAEEKPIQKPFRNGGKQAIYLNGQAGSDDNDGSAPDKALKTFEKAKQLIKDTIDKIFVTGTTDVSGEMSLKGFNTKVLRGESFNDYLFRVKSGNSLTLSDIIIDGNFENNKNIEKSLIYLGNDSILNIKEGTVLKNNKIKDIKNTATYGGAIYANKATINMIGGTISKNAAVRGGGIYLNGSTMDFTNGVIEENTAKRVIDNDVSTTQYYGAGGGIVVDRGSSLNFSGDAIVRNNTSAEVGGGISLGTRTWEEGNNRLTMKGGIVDGNTAGAAGGGIFVQARFYSGGTSTAEISAGQIINNKMDGTGYTDKAFGGGGIYVNGIMKQYGSNGQLNLTNVIVTDNTSEWEGAGYAACPVSDTKIYVTDGGAIYGNKTNDEGREIYILSYPWWGAHSGEPRYIISKRMLGGKLYNWKKSDGTLLSDEEHQGKLNYFEALKLQTDEVGNDLTEKLGKVIIRGNYSATRGGGIGSNGTVEIGTPNPLKELEIKKEWIGVDPKEIQLEIGVKIDGKDLPFETVVLNEENNFTIKLEDLPYTIKDQQIEDILYIKELTKGDYKFTVSEIKKLENKKVIVEGLNGEEFKYDVLSFGVTATNKIEPEEPEKPEEPEESEEPAIPDKPEKPQTPEKPSTNRPETPGGPPKTYDSGIAMYMAIAISSILGLGMVEKKKRK